jgi:Flp pilus assembly protein TadD
VTRLSNLLRVSSRLLTSLCALALLLVLPPAQAALADEVAALLSQDRKADALARTQQALLVAPRDAQTRFLHALVQLELGRDAEALDGFTQLSQEFPELPEPLNNIALLQVRAGKLDAARVSLEAALRNSPSHRAARANLAEVHLMLAVAAWERLAQAAPLEARQAQRLQAVRALLAAPVLAAR